MHLHFLCYFFPLQIALQEHPEVETIRSKGCQVYEQLQRIFLVGERNAKYAFAAPHAATNQVPFCLTCNWTFIL